MRLIQSLSRDYITSNGIKRPADRALSRLSRLGVTPLPATRLDIYGRARATRRGYLALCRRRARPAANPVSTILFRTAPPAPISLATIALLLIL